MKTPREILFEQHRAAEPMLDAVRQRALATIGCSADFQSAVSQISNLLARITIQRHVKHTPPRPAGGPADYKSAIRQIENLRYEAASRSGIRHLLQSLRWHLAGMSALWLLIAFLSGGHSAAPARKTAEKVVPSPQQLLASLRENRRQVLELIGSSISDAAPVPRRRSEIQQSGFTA